MLEGPHLLGEAIEAGLELEAVLMTPELGASEVGRKLSERLPRPALEIDPKLLDELSDSDSPRGVVALAMAPDRGLNHLPLVDSGLYVFADGLQDPGNLGALARVAEAAGAGGLVTARGSCHAGHPRALRASAGSLLRLPVAEGVEVTDLTERLEPLDPAWATLDPRGGRSIYRVDWRSRAMVLVVGAEGPGVSPDALARADLRLTIPMCPPVESLNATVSAAVVLFERLRAITAE